MTKKGKKKKDKEPDICLQKAEIKTLLDEAREGGVCDTAADFIKKIDEEYEQPEKKKPLKDRIKKALKRK